MANFTVTQSTDDGRGTVQGSLSWAIKQANATAGDDQITLSTDVLLIDEPSQLTNSNITIEGAGASSDGDSEFNIDGGSAYRPLFIQSGTVTINNTDIVNGLAIGENGEGGGAGLGGGIFINSGSVTLSNVDVENNAAIGGAGGGFSNNDGSGGSFNPLFSGGSPGAIVGREADQDTDISGGSGGFGSGGGAGGFAEGEVSRDYFFEYQGYIFDTYYAPGQGGNGGFGGFGGGGGGAAVGSVGYFESSATGTTYGDYYGGNSGSAGIGGFGGGNGGNTYEGDPFYYGLYSGYGGGGAGLGGGVFIRTGSLNLADVEFSNNLAEGGYGGGADFELGIESESGQGLGGALFALHITENTNGNNSGMPDELPIVNITSATFTDNSATDAANSFQLGIGENLNNSAVFGTTTLVIPEVPFSNKIQGTKRRDQVSGTRAADGIFGFGGNDFLSGDRGNDLIDGGNGNDRLLGEQGNDVLLGGSGNDFLIGDNGNDTLNGGQGRDRLFGGKGDDALIGKSGNDILKAEAGDDLLDGGRGKDKLLGGTGNDQLIGFTGNDLLQGDAGDDLLDGGQGRDKLIGGEGSDELIGGTGNDFLTGGAGNDRIFGGEGKDKLIGGGGSDTFVIASGGRLPVKDVIVDFQIGRDKIEVLGMSSGDLRFQGSNIFIRDTNEAIASLTGIDTTTLTAADFV